MNHRTALEILIIAMILSLGIPVFALLGADHGARLAAEAYPDAKPAGPAAAPVDYRRILLASEDAAIRGKNLFQANCIACHGASADGKGAAASSLVPAPRNFLDADARWTRSREPLDIYKTLTEGNPGTAMMGFSVSLSVEERWALVHYLGTLPGVIGKFKPVDDALAASWKPGAGR